MFRFNIGLRKKTILGFCLLICLLAVTTSSTIGIIRNVQHRIINVEIIDDILKTTLEMRRFEKNDLLYHEERSFLENLMLLGELENLLKKNRKLLVSIITEESLRELRESLADYKSAVAQLHWINGSHATVSARTARYRLEETVRSAGKKLTCIVEQTADTERQAIQKLFITTDRVLIMSMILLMFIGIVPATFLGRSVAGSLKILEIHTRKISKGEFVTAAVNVADDEISSLLNAFNQMTSELQTRQRQVVQSEKLASLGTMLSGVVHELNNPLSNISTSAQILAEESEDRDLKLKKTLIRQIIEQSDRAGGIIQLLLDYARPHDFNHKKLHLKQLVDETNILLHSQVPDLVTIEVNIDQELTITVDKHRIQQVFLNLVKNAVDAVGHKGDIRISAEKEKKTEDMLILIEDNGPGISDEIRTMIFDPFFTTKDIGHGSGIGLYIANDIIEAHGGTIRIDGREREGTAFIIRLPAERRRGLEYDDETSGC